MALDGIVSSPHRRSQTQNAFSTSSPSSSSRKQYTKGDELGSCSTILQRHRFLLTALTLLAFLCTIYLYFAITLGASCGFDRDPESVVSSGAGKSNHGQRKVQIPLVRVSGSTADGDGDSLPPGLKVKLQSFLLSWDCLSLSAGASSLGFRHVGMNFSIISFFNLV